MDMPINADVATKPSDQSYPIQGMTASQLEAEQAKKDEQYKPKQNEQVVTALAGYIRSCFDSAKQTKQQNNIDNIILKSQRQRNGEYESDVLTQINKTGGSNAYMRLTAQKCVSAESWIRDVLLPTDGTPFSIDPSPLPEVNPKEEQAINAKLAQEIQGLAQDGIPPVPEEIEEMKELTVKEYRRQISEDAKKKSDAMMTLIQDQLIDADFDKAFNDVINDICEFPVGILKGPFLCMEKKLKYVKGADGKFAPKMESQRVIKCRRVHPKDFFPSPESGNPQEGYLLERVRFQPKDLLSFKGIEGYSIENINKAYADYGMQGYREYVNNETEANRLEAKSTTIQGKDRLIDALEFWGSAPGQMLKDWGMDVEDVNMEYDIWAILVGNYVIKAELNPDALGRRPYHVSSWEKRSGSIWGYGIPQKMESSQQFANSTYRALIDNISISARPQVEIDNSRLVPGQEITKIWSGKIWLSRSKDGQTGQAFHFFSPESHAQELLAIIDTCKGYADDETGIPRYIQGDQQGAMRGAAGTASGLSMLMNAASKTIKNVITNIDSDIISSFIHMLYDWNMMYAEDDSVKGDCVIRTRGAINMTIKEQIQVRRMEFLNFVLKDPELRQLIGIEGIAAFLRENVKTLDMPTEQIIPDKDTLKNRIEQIQQQQMMQQQAQQMQLAMGGQPGEDIPPANNMAQDEPMGDAPINEGQTAT